MRLLPLDRAVLASARAVDVRQLAQEMLPSIAEEFGACVVGCFVDRQGSALEGHAPSDMPELVSEYSRVYAGDDPLHAAKSAAGESILIPTRLIERKTFHRSAAYAGLYQPWKIEHIAVLQTRERGAGGDGLGIVIGRNLRRGDFSSDHLRAFRRLLPTLWAVSERLLDAERALHRTTALTVLAEALEKDAATLLLDADGRLVWRSVKAQRDFDANVCAAAIAETARSLCRSKIVPATSVALEYKGARVRVALSLLEGADARGPFVLARLKDHAEPDALERWAATAGLTKGEARVLRALCDGGTNAEIGRRLFVSPATVRTHVDHIFRKLGVSSRLQAVLKAQREARAIVAT